MTKLNKVVVVLDEKKIKEITEGKVDKRTLNTGRPVNKKSARQARLAKQAFYANVNSKFVSGKKFKINNDTVETYAYSPSTGKYISSDNGCIIDGIGSHVCNIDYVGRTKVQGYKFVLGKKVNIELNLKTLQFVS